MTPVTRRRREAARGSSAQGTAAAGAWNFAEDEDDTPTWRQIVGGQAIDLVLFSAFAAWRWSASSARATG